MIFFIVLYCVATGVVIIWCSLQKPERLLECIAISPWWLRNYKQRLANLIVIELRDTARSLSTETLIVPVTQLNGLLRWIPPQTTLVLDGKREFDLCRAEIEETLIELGIGIVYIVDEDLGSPPDRTLWGVARYGELD